MTRMARSPLRDHLPSVTPAAQDARLRYWLEVRGRLDGIAVAQLSPAERLNFEIYRPQIDVLIEDQRFRDFEMPANSDSSFWTDLGYTARRPFRTLEDYRHWIAQMRDVPRYFKEQTDEMRAGLRRGFTPPRVTLQGRDASIAAITDLAPESGPFYVPFKEMPGILPADRTQLRAEALSVIRERVLPAYRELLTFVRNDLCAAHPRHPGGRRSPRWQGVLPREDPGIHHTRQRSGGDPRPGSARGGAAARRDDRRHAGDRIRRRSPGVPRAAAQRSALLCEDSGRAV